MLKDDYETLLRRGMPKHYELRYSGGAWCLIQGHIEESDARDLITMHALRWVVDCEIELKRYVKWTAHDGFCIDTENGNGWQAYCDPLDAILAATAHLEPR